MLSHSIDPASDLQAMSIALLNHSIGEIASKIFVSKQGDHVDNSHRDSGASDCIVDVDRSVSVVLDSPDDVGSSLAANNSLHLDNAPPVDQSPSVCFPYNNTTVCPKATVSVTRAPVIVNPALQPLVPHCVAHSPRSSRANYAHPNCFVIPRPPWISRQFDSDSGYSALSTGANIVRAPPPQHFNPVFNVYRGRGGQAYRGGYQGPRIDYRARPGYLGNYQFQGRGRGVNVQANSVHVNRSAFAPTAPIARTESAPTNNNNNNNSAATAPRHRQRHHQYRHFRNRNHNPRHRELHPPANHHQLMSLLRQQDNEARRISWLLHKEIVARGRFIDLSQHPSNQTYTDAQFTMYRVSIGQLSLISAAEAWKRLQESDHDDDDDGEGEEDEAAGKAKDYRVVVISK